MDKENKEQIIIDTNKYFVELTDESRGTIGYTVVFPGDLLEDIIRQNRQLARKTQECKKLNDKIIDMNSIIEDAAINLGNKDFTLYDLPFEIKKLRKECDIWKNQVLILDEEDVTVQVTQEQFEEYQKLKQACEQLKEDYAELEQECEKPSILAQEESARNGRIEYELNDKLKQKTQELYFARNEVHSKTEYIQEQRDIIDQLKQECEELKERLVRTEEDLKYQCVDCMNVKSDRYRKALEEIENLMQTVNDADECSYGDFDCCNCDSDNSCPTKVKRLILDIISKAKRRVKCYRLRKH